MIKKIKQIHNLLFLRRFFLFSFFMLSSACSVVFAKDFWWNPQKQISTSDSAFPKTARNNEKTVSFWQEIDEKTNTIYLSAQFLDSAENEQSLTRFAGPFEYAGKEIPELYSAAMNNKGLVVIAVQASDQLFSIYSFDVNNFSQSKIKKTDISVLDSGLLSPRIFATSGGKFVMFASRSKETDSVLHLHEFYITHAVSENGTVWSNFTDTFQSSAMPNSFSPFMCSSENAEYLVFQAQYSQKNRNTYQIYLSKSENNGKTWSEATLVTGDDSVLKGSFFEYDNQGPFILYSDGKLNLVWERKESGKENSDIWFEQIKDNQILLESVDVITSRGNSRKAGIFTYNNNLFVHWTDNRTGFEQIYLAKKGKVSWEETKLTTGKNNFSFSSFVINKNEPGFLYQSESSNGKKYIDILTQDKYVSKAQITAEKYKTGSRTKNTKVTYKIKLPEDTSGIQGYTYSWSKDEDIIPQKNENSIIQNGTLNLTAESEGLWYLKVRVLDNAGNYSEIAQAEYNLDLTPPQKVVFKTQNIDEAGFLSSNSSSVQWEQNPQDNDISSYSYSLVKVSEIPQKYCSTPLNKTKTTIQEQKDFITNLLESNEKALNRKITQTQTNVKSPIFTFKNQRNGLYILSVCAIDQAGLKGKEERLPIILNKYVPHTYITSIKENVSTFGDISIEITGNDFLYDGNVNTIIIDSNGKKPYDIVISKNAQNFKVTNTKITGINLGSEIQEGSYYVGLIHSSRGFFRTKTKALNISENGTVQIEPEYKYTPAWKAVQKKYSHSIFAGYIVLIAALVFFILASIVFLFSFFKNYREIYSTKKIVQELKSGGLLMQSEKTGNSENKRNGSLKTSLAGFAICLVVAIIIVISLSLGMMMIKEQERTLSKGLHDRVNVLLTSVFTGARTYLRNADESTMEFNDLLNQMSSLSEAEFLTITGEVSENNTQNQTDKLSEDSSLLYVWASNDSEITKKVNTLTNRKTIIPGISVLTKNSDTEKDIANRCLLLNDEAKNLCAESEEKIATLNTELKGATSERRREISTLNASYRSQIQKELLNLSEKGTDSIPPYNDEKFNRNVTEYLFYRPVLYNAANSGKYVHGILFLKVNTQTLISDVNKATRNILYIVLALSSVTIVLGILGANVFAGRIVKPIQMLEKTVTEISEENDKERLLAGDITDLPNNEIGRLGDSVNRMKKDLGYNERELNLQANEATPIQQSMVSLEPLSGNFKQNISRISDEKISEFAYYKGASGASGDYFDFKKLDDRWYVLIKCDASGHAAPAGILVTIVATLYKKYFEDWSYQKNGTKLEDFVYKINGFLESLNIKGKFVAMIITLYDSKTGNVYMCHAGDRFVRIYDDAQKTLKRLELIETPAAGPFPNFMLEMKGGFKVETATLKPKDSLLLYTDGIEENGRILRTPDFAAVLKPKTDSNGQQIYDEYGNPEYEAEKEEFGEERVKQIVEAVFKKQVYILTKKNNPSPLEELKFDFSTCKGTVEEAILALSSLEKVFRLYKPLNASAKDLVEVDRAIDGFLKEHFSLYNEYAKNPTEESFNGRPVRNPKNPNNIYYAYIKEDVQDDDLTMISLQRN